MEEEAVREASPRQSSYGDVQLVCQVQRAAHVQVREAVAGFIEAHPEAEIGGSPLQDWIQWESGGGVAAYCRRMRGSGEWGGAIELAVFSRLFMTTVEVFEKEGASAYRRISAFDAPGAAEEKGKVRVLYSGRVHYDALEGGAEKVVAL